MTLSEGRSVAGGAKVERERVRIGIGDGSEKRRWLHGLARALMLVAAVGPVLVSGIGASSAGALSLRAAERGQATQPARGTTGTGGATVAPGPQNNPIRGSEINEAQKRAVERGLAYLAGRQRADGAFGDGSGESGYSVAVTALAALAFMQGGNLPGRGKYGGNVRKAVEFICNNTSEAGLISADKSASPMYGHGFATLFLAEVYGMTGDDEVKEKLTRAVRLILRAHATNAEGGWRYQHDSTDADISVTICQIMALRAARDAGIKVPKSDIDRAIAYVRSCQNQADGGFTYMSQKVGGGGESGYARTAAGIASLFYAGVYEGDDIARGLAFVRKFIPGKTPPPQGESHYFYGHYYGVQAMFLAGGENWGTYYPAIRDQLCARQAPQGSWTGDLPGDSSNYATAMALLILQMPNRYLPVFTGKGPGG